MAKDLCKVHFKVVQDEDGYPPFTSEGIWCARLDEHRFRLENIPFFVTGVSYGDVISVRESPEGFFSFDQVTEEKGHSTLRVMFLDNPAELRSARARADELRNSLRALGCSVDLSPPPELLAVDVPPEAALEPIRNVLSAGEESGFWSYEEATLAH